MTSKKMKQPMQEKTNENDSMAAHRAHRLPPRPRRGRARYSLLETLKNKLKPLLTLVQQWTTIVFPRRILNEYNSTSAGTTPVRFPTHVP